MGETLSQSSKERTKLLEEVYKKLSPLNKSSYLVFERENEELDKYDCMELYFKGHGFI